MFFYKNKWYNVIGQLKHDGIYYYCNMASPFILEDGAIKYIDYDLDVKVFPDMTFHLLDEDEYERHRQEMHYPKVIDTILKKNVNYLIFLIRQQKGPFSAEFIDSWYERYLMYR